MPGDDVVEGGERSLVGDVSHGNPERGLEQLAHEMMKGAGAARAIAQRPLARELDQIDDGVDRQIRIDHEHERHVADQRCENHIAGDGDLDTPTQRDRQRSRQGPQN